MPEESHKSFIAGTMGGLAAKLVEYPFDTVKVLLQTQSSSVAAREAGGVVVHQNAVAYRNALHCFTYTIETQGIRSLYKGLSSPLMGCMAENALLFWAYSHTKRILATTSGDAESSSSSKKKDLTLFQLSLAGGAAGAVVPLVLTPVELIKCRMQVQNSFGLPYQSPLEVMGQVVKHEGGIRALYKGYVATLLREVPGNFVWFGLYEGTCMYFTPENGTKKDLPLWVHLLGGALAGMGFWTAAYPLDTIKSRMQTRGGGLVENFADIWRMEGRMRILFRGWGITMVRAAPAHALIFAVYEQTMNFLNKADSPQQFRAPEPILVRRTTL